MSLVGQVLGGRYRVLTSIARGGMGTVYEAEDLRLSRRVAPDRRHPLRKIGGFALRKCWW